MIKIILARLIGLIIPIFIWTSIDIDADSTGGRVLVYAILLALIGFLEYQIAHSRRHGQIYFRGWITQGDKQFVYCQWIYAFQSGFFIGAILQAFF